MLIIVILAFFFSFICFKLQLCIKLCPVLWTVLSRCIGSRKLQINQKLLTVSATNPNSGGGKSSNEGSDVTETGNPSQGPPLLTILAGLFVFFLVGWVIGSVVVWLLSLIVNVPSPK